MDASRERGLALLCWTCGGWAFSFGLGSQAVSLWLLHRGHSNMAIGLSHTAYYGGLALGSLLAPVLLRGWGRWCPTLGLILSGLSLAAFPWGAGLGGFLLLRLVNGIAGALSLVPLETYISRGSAPEQRTRQFAFYGVALTLGGAIGVWSGLHLYRPGAALGFLIGGAVPMCGACVLARGLTWPRLAADEAAAATPRCRGRHFLSFATAWCQGFLEGGMLAFLSLYLLSRGLSVPAAGALMALTMAGVILFQVPVSWLADRLGRRPVLYLCYGMVAAMLFLTPRCESALGLGAALFVFGGCTGAMYPLGLALLGERTPESALARAYAWYLTIECLGSQLGAILMGEARDRWGGGAMFGVGLAAVLGVPAAWVVVALRRRARMQPSVVQGPGVRQAA